jgi:hypothetical protein
VNRAATAIAVALLCLWAVAVAVAALVNAASVGSRFGFSVDLAAGGRVSAVVAGSPAAAAGLLGTDRIVAADTPATQRDLLVDPTRYKPAGTRLDLTVLRAGRLIPLVLYSRSVTDRVVVAAVGLAVTLVFVGVGGALVLLRPNAVTWPFLLMSFAYVISEYGAVPPAYATLTALNAILIAASVGLAFWAGGWFIVNFPEGSRTRWDRAFRVFVIVTAPLIGLMEYFGSTVEYYVGIGVLIACLLAIAVVRFFEGGADRSRTLWVLVGSLIGFSAVGLHAGLSVLDPVGFPPSVAGAVVSFVPVAWPLAVAYAVLRHRVIDVRFALNRAVVYGTLTSGLVLFFSFVEWLIGKKLEATRLAFYVDLAMALGMGFWFNALHQRVERVVESALFRQQRRAEQRLERVERAIPHAPAVHTVDAFLCDDPAEAYELASAAVFRRSDDGAAFERVHATGWHPADVARIAEAEPLIAHLAAGDESLALADVRAPLDARYPAGEVAPILAVPITARARLIGFALYGAHRSGEALNPDERHMLHRLAVAAAAAYDHLEADELRREVERLRGVAEGVRPVSVSP